MECWSNGVMFFGTQYSSTLLLHHSILEGNQLWSK